MTPEMLERVASIAGAILTVMIFSYLIGDNVLYRIAVSVFVGAAAAYTLIVAVENVILPWVQLTFDPASPLSSKIIGVVPFVIGILLLAKFIPALSRLGNIGFAAVLGVGTALALWGAVTGSLVPLAIDAARSRGNILDSLIAVVATISVLIYFTYLGVRRPNGDVEQSVVIRTPGLVGQAFIMITLGATYGLLIISAATILTGVVAQRLMIFKP